MCRQHQGDEHDALQDDGRHPIARANEPFPWHLPIYDAHCHPTDTMDSIASFNTMRVSALAIMATRSQDQELVAEVASLHGVKECASLRGRHTGEFHQLEDGLGGDGATIEELDTQAVRTKCHVIPSFGWHPWFSYQLYDDVTADPTYDASGEDEAALRRAKRKHYQSVLSPAPEDDDFIASLPAPISLSSFVNSTKDKLQTHPTALVGEIGLDKAFRLPQDWNPELAASRDDGLTPGGREGRRLSPYRVQMQQQQAILRAQLRLAGEVGRPVSVHGVQAHGILFDTVSGCWKGHERHVPSRREKRKIAPGAEEDDSDHGEEVVGGKPYPPRICLHSYSGPVEGLRQWLRPTIPAKIYFSFSTGVNLGTNATRSKFEEVVKAVPGDKLLVESDLHRAGEAMEAALEDMYRRVCAVKGWSLEEGVRRIARNFEEFVFG